MTQFEVPNPEYETAVRASFAKQTFMDFLGARLTAVSPGNVIIELPVTPDLLQQHRFVHAGATTAVVDTACGYATLSLLPPGSEVVTVEFKMNLLAPALGVKMIAHGRVVRPGRTLTVCQGELFGEDENGTRKLCAIMTATMIRR